MPLATLLQRWQPAGQKSYKTTKGEVCSCGVCQAKEIVCRSEKGKDWIFFSSTCFFSSPQSCTRQQQRIARHAKKNNCTNFTVNSFACQFFRQVA